MKHNTLKDIAKKLKISASTVSRALSNHPDISEETRTKVKALADKLNYSPNPIAQSLKSNKTTTIGVIVPEIKHDFFSSAISGIEDVAYQSGYTILLSQSNESFEREVVNTNALMRHRVAGVIVSISQNTKNSDHFKLLLDRSIPLVFFDRACDDVEADKVVIDDEKSAYEAVMHLINKGYKNIAHLAGPKELSVCKNRLQGYLSAIKCSKQNEFILYGGMHEDDGFRSMDLLIAENNLPDAIFCVNDPVAMGAYQRIMEAGLQIPKDIGIVGFSNNKITNMVIPKITTVDQPSFEMGKKAAEILIDLIENPSKKIKPKTIVLNTSLIVRSST
jgi:DNA-binding LacI/PurR family transcriptional regulator